MNELPVVFPFGGLNEEFAKTDQPPTTTRNAVNVCVREVLGDRARGGSREGIALHAGTMPSSAAVRQIAVVPYDNRGSTYADGAGVEEWNEPTPLTQMARAVAIDADRNRYAIDGNAGIAKWNADGNLVWKFVAPVDSQEHIIRALAVDDDGTFYVGVSAGHPQSTARLMKFRPSESGTGVPALEWTLGGANPTEGLELGCYVERLRLRGGVLYAACNFTDSGSAEIRMYRSIDTAVPELAWKRTQVPYPINSLDVRDVDGAILSCHESNSTRAKNPKSPDTGKLAVDWTPDRLTKWDERKWCELDASDIDGDGSFNSAYSGGDAIDLWTDKTGSGRNAYSHANAGLTAPSGCTPPTLNKSKRFSGQDSVLFNATGATHASAHNGLVSLGGEGSIMPTYSGGKYCVFMVLRSADVAANPRAALTQINAQPSTLTRAVLLNANTTGGGPNFWTAAAGVASFYQNSAAGPYASYNTTTGFCLVAFTVNNDGTSTTTDHCSVNGVDCTNESYTGTAITSVFGTQIGRGAESLLTNVGGWGPFSGEIAYLLVLRDYSSGSIISDEEFQKIEGYLHWRFGITLPGAHPYELQPPTDDPLTGSDSAYLKLTDTEAMLVKWDPNKARPRWILKEDSTPVTGTGIGGIGYDCAWPQNGATDKAFSHGPKGAEIAGATDTQKRAARSVVRGVKDSGDSVLYTGAGTWEGVWGVFTSGTAADSLDPTYHYPKCCVSGLAANSPQDGTSTPNFYVPYHVAAAYPSIGVRQYIQGSAPPSNTPGTSFTLASGSRGYACAVEREIPEYSPGQLSSRGDQYVFVGTEKQGASTDAVSNLRLVDETRSDANPRTVYTLAMTASDARRVTSGGALATPTTSPTLAGRNYISAVGARQRIWIADGSGYFVLDPRVGDGVSKAWKSKSAGSLPKNCKLLSYWFDCMVAARGEQHDLVTMSAIGDPYNWDLFPSERSGGEAVAFSAGEAVNAIVPVTRDMMLVGTQTKVLMLEGHPAQGGILHRLGDVQGVAFGEAWCKDPDGAVYLFGSRGGVMRWNGRQLQSISDNKIRKRLQEIDTSSYFVRLEWDWKRDGLYVVPIPQSTGSGTPFLYFWHRPTDSWWKYEVPWWITSIRQVDGDDFAAREVWLGCADGKIRKFSASSETDDGVAVDWGVDIGPYRARGSREQIVLSRPKLTLGSESADTLVALYASGDSERPAVARESYLLSGTLSNTAPIRARGANVWLRLSGSGFWAFEDGSVLAEPFGLRQELRQ